MRDRGKLLRWFMDVALACAELNNFNAVVEIRAAMNSAPLHRLKKSFAEVLTSLRTEQNAVKKAQASSEMMMNAKCLVICTIPIAWSQEKRRQMVATALGAVPTHRRPVKLFTPTQKDGSRAKVMIGECKNISDRQACVAALREDAELKAAGVGARTQRG